MPRLLINKVDQSYKSETNNNRSMLDRSSISSQASQPLLIQNGMRLKKQFGEIRNTTFQIGNDKEILNKKRDRKISDCDLSTNATNRTLNSQNMNNLPKQSDTTNS